MRTIRHVYEGTDRGAGARFAHRCGLTYTRWQNYESGYPLSLEAALAISEALPELTISYLLLGKWSEAVAPAARRKLNGHPAVD